MSRHSTTRCCWQGLFLALPALLCGFLPTALAQGTIMHYNPPDIGLFFGGTWDLDLNLDRQADFFFRSTQGEFEVFPRGDNAVLARRNAPPDLSRWCTPLPLNAEISSIAPVGVSWVPLETIHGYELASAFNSCRDVGCIGDFIGHDAYLGVRFCIGEGLHYGWVRVNVPDSNIAGGYILEWAYETRPDTPILAGTIPEPSGVVLLLFGGLALLAARRRLTARHNSTAIKTNVAATVATGSGQQ